MKMKVRFDLQELKVGELSDSMINIGKNWVVTPKRKNRGDQGGVGRMGGDVPTAKAYRSAGRGEPTDEAPNRPATGCDED